LFLSDILGRFAEGGLEAAGSPGSRSGEDGGPLLSQAGQVDIL